MISFCEHEPGLNILTHIKDPKWSTNEVLIDTKRAQGEHIVIRFANPSPKKKYGWFYYPGNLVRKHRTQPNGRGEVYVVPLEKRKDFKPIIECEHNHI